MSYIHEEPFGIKEIIEDLEALKFKMEKGKIQRGLILRNEHASENYDTDFTARIYAEEGRGIFSGKSRNLFHRCYIVRYQFG